MLCGVSFMGESVKLLNPGRRVLMPAPEADCPMAHMVEKAEVDRIRATYDDVAVVAYVNTTAEVKTWADVCVTSSNALKVVRELPQRNIFFIPDANLGSFIARQVPEKNVILNMGCCPIHDVISLDEVRDLKAAHPAAEVLAHPECRPDVLAEADYIGSTKEIINRVAASDASEFIVLTVAGVAAEIERLTPGQNKRVYFPATTPICPNMAKVTPERLLACLEDLSGEVALPERPEAAGAPLERMLELAAR